MDFVYNLILVLHFIGLASVVGGFLVQMKSPDKGVNPAMLHGAITQLVTGLLLVGLPEMGLALPYPTWESWDHVKIGVKLLLTIVITVLAIIGRRKQLPQTGLWGAIGGLSIANILIAVFW
jgi:NO-binding membrane sensor protein with MHYT domain